MHYECLGERSGFSVFSCIQGGNYESGQGVKQAVCYSWLAGQNGWCALMQG